MLNKRNKPSYIPAPNYYPKQYDNYKKPYSRQYSNPYSEPPKNYYPYYDTDQYYTPPYNYYRYDQDSGSFGGADTKY